mmetsp:Transcript_12378/g.31999  ORF Transcript_12378/g.31999 Transcript_12378/m.31999 type:complete len:242 (-) Transcript_12378:641-1366(-)
MRPPLLRRQVLHLPHQVLLRLDKRPPLLVWHLVIAEYPAYLDTANAGGKAEGKLPIVAGAEGVVKGAPRGPLVPPLPALQPAREPLPGAQLVSGNTRHRSELRLPLIGPSLDDWPLEECARRLSRHLGPLLEKPAHELWVRVVALDNCNVEARLPCVEAPVVFGVILVEHPILLPKVKVRLVRGVEVDLLVTVVKLEVLYQLPANVGEPEEETSVQRNVANGACLRPHTVVLGQLIEKVLL